MNIPTTSNAFTAAWLTETLRSSKVITQATVTTCTVQPLSGHHDFGSQQVRLGLAYDRAPADAPRTMLAKFSAADPEIRKLRRESYAREVNFYQQVAPLVTLRTPRCYYSAFDPESGAHVLLLEDLAPAANPTWEEGCTLAQTEKAIRQIAGMHAAWWESPQLIEKRIGQPDHAYLCESQHRYQSQAWAACEAKLGEQMPPAIRALGQELGEQYVNVFTYLQQPPVTLTHFNYSPGSLFFGREQSGIPFAVANWQMMMVHRGVFDVASLLSVGTEPAVRRQNEQAWLTLYHTTLCEQGVQNYSLEQCRFDYRLSLLRNFMRLVIMVGRRPLGPEQAHLNAEIMLPRTCAAMLDFDVRAVLAELESKA